MIEDLGWQDQGCLQHTSKSLPCKVTCQGHLAAKWWGHGVHHIGVYGIHCMQLTWCWHDPGQLGWSSFGRDVRIHGGATCYLQLWCWPWHGVGLFPYCWCLQAVVPLYMLHCTMGHRHHLPRIHVTLTEETGAAPPPPHAWTVPLVQDMLCYGRTGLTEAIVMGMGRAVLFYGRQSMGEGLSLGEARDAAFTLIGTGTWVGKPAYLAADPLTIQEGRWTIAQAITECQTEARGPGQPCLLPLTPQPFRFHHPGDSPWQAHSRDASLDHQPSPNRPQRGWDCNWCRRDQRLLLPQPPLPSPDCGFESNWSSVLTASLVSSQSDRLEGSWHSQHGRWHRETRGHMKINLPIFKDENTKDAITYHSWRWDLMVYHHVGCRDCTLLPYTISSLQGYPRELVQSLGMNITLDNILTILDKHYNNAKALDALYQEFVPTANGR